MWALQRADSLGSPPAWNIFSFVVGTGDDSLNRGSSLGAGSSIGCHCSTKAFTVTSNLKAAGGLVGGGELTLQPQVSVTH